MTPTAQAFFILLISGLTLLGAEVFVPGGILGVLGGLALFGAVISGFVAFPDYGIYIAVGILLLSGLAIVLWIKIFPSTKVGRMMAVSGNLAGSTSADSRLPELAGKQGEATSELRPAGFATIDGRRIDVVTRGEMVPKGSQVRVLKVEGSRVIVAQVKS